MTSLHFIINNVKYTFKEEIPLQIFDIISQSMENTVDFLSDINNVIFKIENNFVGISKYFYPFDNRSIIYNCDTKNVGQLFRSIREFPDQNIEYFNMETIGIILESPNQDIGVLVKASELEMLIQTAKIIRLDLNNVDFVIRSVASKAVLESNGNYSYVGALHCQGNYTGQVFDLLDLLENEEHIPFKKETYTVKLSNSSLPSFQTNERFINLVFKNNEYITNSEESFAAVQMLQNTTSIFNLHKKTRDYLINDLGYVNPLQYPDDYFEICEKEKEYRNLQSFEHLINITLTSLREMRFVKDSPEFNNILNSKVGEVTADKSTSLNDILKIVREHKNNIVIAGGYALFKFFNFNGKNIKYSDVDLFLHSCSQEQAKKIILSIVHLLEENYKVSVKNSEHAYTLDFTPNGGYPCTLQFIKRLYQSPSEIIHGFDIDCTCILMTLETIPVFYATERGYYAIRHSCNFVNFDHLSPSYEYRCLKYLNRGFDLFIPQMIYFKENFVFNQNLYPKPLTGGYVILKYLLDSKHNVISDYNPNVFDNNYNKTPFLNKNDLSFMITNPSSQATSTFNVTVHEDNINWYPKIDNDYFIPPDLQFGRIFEIGEEFFNDDANIYGKNIVAKQQKVKLPYKYDDVLSRLLNIFSNQFVIVGDVPLGILSKTKFLASPICICFLESKNIKKFEDVSDIINMLERGFSSFYEKTYILPDRDFINNLGVYAKNTYREYYDFIEFEYFFESIDSETEQIPRLQISKKIYSNYTEVLNSQKYDFQRIIYDGKYYTDERGEYCIRNKINLNKNYVFNSYQKLGYKDLLKNKSLDEFILNDEEFIDYLNTTNYEKSRIQIKCFGISLKYQIIRKDQVNTIENQFNSLKPESSRGSPRRNSSPIRNPRNSSFIASSRNSSPVGSRVGSPRNSSPVRSRVGSPRNSSPVRSRVGIPRNSSPIGNVSRRLYSGDYDEIDEI